MPMLLEDLAEETTASNRRAANRLDVEVRDLNESRRGETSLDELRQKAVASASEATTYALSQLPRAEGVWNSALVALRKNPFGHEAERILNAVLGVFESGLGLLQAPRPLWQVATELGATSERTKELDQAQERFQQMIDQVKSALEHRRSNWQPADPERFALGLKQAREGRTISADEAIARFRRR